MNITLVIWHITKGREGEFEDRWRTGFKLIRTDGLVGGLVGEFLCRASSAHPPFGQDFADSNDTTYINVAIWKDEASFLAGVPVPPPNGRQEFEARPRERCLLSAITGRLGPVDFSEFVDSVDIVE